MKVTTKLYGLVGALALTGGIVAVGGAWYLRSLGDELSAATGKTAIDLDLVNAARARTWEMVAALRGMYVFANLDKPAEFEASIKKWEATTKRIHAQIAEIRPLLPNDADRRDLAAFESLLDGFRDTAVTYQRLCRDRQFVQVGGLVATVQAFTGKADETLNRMKDRQRQALKESQRRAASLRAQSMWVNLLLTGVLLAIAAASGFSVRGIARALTRAVARLSQGAGQVAAAAQEISAASQALAQGSSEQAASLQETSASSEEVSSMARKNSECTRDAAGLVTQSRQQSADANRLLERMVTAMGEIDAQSEKIARIIKVIDEVAFQTNILALNAAVEAARAGEAGMGFAVVADEVRNLAQRCAQAAKDTAESIEASIALSRGGRAKVNEMAAAIRGATEDSAKLKSLVDAVDTSSQEQARGMEQIGKALAQMDRVTQTTAATAQQTAASAHQLEAQAETLREVVRGLSAMVGSGGQ